MIIDIPTLSNLVIGSDRIEPEIGDSRVSVPPIIMASLTPRLPFVATGTGATANSSILWSASFTRTNSAGGPTSTLVTLPRGLYELYIAIAARFDYTNVGAVPDVELEIVSGTFAEDLLGLYAFIGAQSVNAVHRLLLISTATIRMSTTANGVGQNMDFTGFVNAQRLI